MPLIGQTSMDKNKKNWKNWLACFRIAFESEHPSIVWAHYAEKQQRLCDSVCSTVYP